MTNQHNQTQALIFIVGVGRSGTSLLQSMFGAHPEVSCLPESAFIRNYVVRRRLDTLYKSGGMSKVFNALEDDPKFRRVTKRPPSQIVFDLKDGGLVDLSIYRYMLASYHHSGLRYVCDKDPRLIEFLPFLGSVFPLAKIINIIRDPRDVLVSKMKADWSKKGHVWKHIFANMIQMEFADDYKNKFSSETYFELRYEDLIRDPGDTLYRLCARIGLGYNQNMLEFGVAARRLVSDSEVSWKKETFGPLLGHNKEKWKAELKSRESVLTEICCRRILEVYQYSLEGGFRKLNLPDKIWVVSGVLVILSMRTPYRLYRRYLLMRARGGSL